MGAWISCHIFRFNFLFSYLFEIRVFLNGNIADGFTFFLALLLFFLSIFKAGRVMILKTKRFYLLTRSSPRHIYIYIYR